MADSSQSEGLNNEEHVSSSPRHSTPRSRKQGMTSNSNMNARSSPGLQDVSTDGISGRDGGGDDSGPSPNKMRSPHPRSSGVGGTDTQSVDTRLSDPDRIKKDREREERVRIARERLEEERKKKLVELQEQQRQAQENREKQLEMRRQKIEDLRRRDTERRAAVEERRRAKEDADRSRRETLLIKAEERVARYEQWRRTGQKGGRSHCLGFGSATPRTVCQPMERPRRSSSHSALMRRSPNGSDSDYSFRPQRRALSACSTIRRHCCVDINRMGSLPTPKHLSVSTSVLYHKRNTDFSSAGMLNISSRPESLVALNTIPEGRRSFLAAMGQLPSRPKSVMTLSGSSTGSASSVVPGGGVRLRETKTPRKPRPASVATSMPSFVAFEPARPSPRSKSSDRLARERSKTRVKSARQSAEKEDEKVEEGKEMVKTAVKTSRGTIDRLSTPKQSPAQGKETATTKRESPVRISPRKAFSTTNLTVPRKKPSIKERPAKEASGKPKHLTPVALAAAVPEDASPSTPVVVPTPAAISTPTSAVATHTPTRVQSPVLAADEDGGSGRPVQTATPGSAGEITAVEYKAKLAEKRRQAREKAEREAEEERRRQEEIQRQEEERRRQEEEEQRRLEEEALRLAEEARQAEEERLRKAIEAEEQRRAEEAARLEQERLAKEESERKAKEEAERLEQERLEKARRDEEERLERKKRLEMIMKRVKTDAPVEGTKETPIKTVTGSPTKNMSSNNSSDSSPTEPEGKGVPEASLAPSEKQDEAEPRSENMESEESQPPVSASLLEAPTQAPPHAKEPDSSTVICMEEEKAEPSPVLAQSNMVFSAMYSPVAASVEMENGGERPKFKSPLLQKLVEGKEDAGVGQVSGGTRFKSPLLQNLLGKTKVGARMGIDRQDHSVSTPDLSSLDRSGASGEARGRGLQPASDAMSASMVEVGGGDASSRKEVMNSSEEKDVDTSEDSSSSSHSSPSHSSSKSARMVANGDGLETSPPLKTVSFVEPIQQTPSNGTEEAMDVSGIVDASAHVDMASSGASFWSEQDSGASFGSDSMRPGASASPLQVSLNGHGLVPHSRLEHAGLEDSSISMRSVESGTTSITDSATGSIFSSVSSLQQSQVQLSVGGDRDFEELIDLTISKKTATSDASDDLINFNKFEDGSEKTSTVPPPIIAFEEPATTIRRQDVKDLLS